MDTSVRLFSLMNWIDTQTKELLQRAPEDKLAPPKAAEFGLILLRKGPDRVRLLKAITQINKCSLSAAIALEKQGVPVTVNPGLTEGEVLWGQFELICCDAISVFLRSEIVEQNDKPYLLALFEKVLESVEFKPAKIKILELPGTESGEKFIDQFLGVSQATFPMTHIAPYKKARIMHHWARRIGGRVELNLSEDGAEPHN